VRSRAIRGAYARRSHRGDGRDVSAARIRPGDGGRARDV